MSDVIQGLGFWTGIGGGAISRRFFLCLIAVGWKFGGLKISEVQSMKKIALDKKSLRLAKISQEMA
jgi:hypothetical protein